MRIKTALLMVLLLCSAAVATAAPQQRQVTANEALSALGAHGITIWFFYLSTCPYCRQEEPILAGLQHQYGLKVEPISLDGGPTPARIFKNYRTDKALASRFGVQATPTLYLVRAEDGKGAKLSSGLVQENDLKKRILAAAQKMGWLEDALTEAEKQRPATEASTAVKPDSQSPVADEDRSEQSLGDSILERLHKKERNW